MRPPVSRRRQVLAVAALAGAGVLLAAVVVFLVGHAVALVVGLAGFALAVAGAWWVITEHVPRRLVGVAGVVAGVAVIAVALAQVVDGIEHEALRLAVVLAVLGATMVAARAAMVRDAGPAPEVRTRPRPTRPVLLCNPWSGGGKVERFGLVELAGELGVEAVLLDHGLDLEQLAREAVARGADCLGMAGGDGSQALVASIAVEHDLPFVCVSAGTRNHFALDLGLDRDDPRGTMRAFVDGLERRVDFATVNDRFFVNNVSLGVYATVVQQEGYREAKAGTAATLLPELLGQQAEPFDLQFTTPAGEDVDGAFLIQVSNNPYVVGARRDAAQRRRLDTGRLGVFAVSTRTGAEAARLMARAALGARTSSPFWHEFTADSFEVRSRSGSAFAGVDGEALELPTPLRFRIHPRGLRLLVPEGNAAALEERRARDVRLDALLAAAGGHEVPER